MNILMLCTKFSLAENDPWLTNELADAFRQKGHAVSVIHLDWWATPGRPTQRLTTSAGTQVVSLAPVLMKSPIPLVSKMLKWGLSSFSALKVLRQQLNQAPVDLVIGFSPAVTMALPILWQARQRKTRSFFVLWDFFPFHQQQIGLISSPLIFRFSKWLESLLLRKFHHIGCMSNANIDYLKSHYTLGADQQLHIVPIWGKEAALPVICREAVREQYGLPVTPPIVVFGGQLVQGRGLEDLLCMAEEAARQGLQTHFLIMGSGVLEGMVTDYLAKGHSNLTWIARVPRDEYLKVAQACDVALVCTVRDVDVPSFPSKTIDYLRLGLPIVASVEKSTDYGAFLMENGVGISVEAGQPKQVLAEIQQLLSCDNTLRDMKQRGPECFSQHFEVGRVASQIIEQVRGTVQK
ncbi:MAG: glycosyltransferase family 4 protein [Pseudomonas sp.]